MVFALLPSGEISRFRRCLSIKDVRAPVAAFAFGLVVNARFRHCNLKCPIQYRKAFRDHEDQVGSSYSKRCCIADFGARDFVTDDQMMITNAYNGKFGVIPAKERSKQEYSQLGTYYKRIWNVPEVSVQLVKGTHAKITQRSQAREVTPELLKELLSVNR